MKKNTLFFCIVLFFSLCTVDAQNYSRKQFDYSKMQEKEYKTCDSSVYEELNLAMMQLDNLQSEQAVLISKKTFDRTKTCPQTYEVYGWSLFRNGKWLEGLEIIENGIDTFGSNPDLISRKAFMGIEMAELGVAQKSIDGNAVYVAKNETLNYDEEQFKKENYKAALLDFEYLSESYEGRYREIMIKGYILQQLEEYEKSNFILGSLLNVDEYRDEALMSIVGNYFKLKQFDKAESGLLEIQKRYPRNVSIQENFTELYKLREDSVKAMESTQKAYFFQYTPSESELEYTKENYSNVIFFATDENNEKSKTEKLKKIIKEKDAVYSTEICLTILKLHANHGNGLEEKACNELITLGKSVLPKTIQMFENDEVSTCTITNLADILATLKDTSGWRALVNYLPRMANLPFTIIPPNVPEKIIKFDKEKGTRVLIEFAKQLIQNEAQTIDTGNPFTELGGFSQNAFYYPLKDIKKNKVISIAKEYNYSEDEIKTLLKKIYG